MNGKLVNNIIIIALVLGLGVAVYLFFFSDKSNDAPGLVSSSGESAGNLTGSETTSNREFLASLNNLKAIKLETAIFSNPEYLDFRDFSLPLDPEPSGRVNPFKEYNPNVIWLGRDDGVTPSPPASSTSPTP